MPALAVCAHCTHRFEPWLIIHRQLAPWHDARFRWVVCCVNTANVWPPRASPPVKPCAAGHIAAPMLLPMSFPLLKAVPCDVCCPVSACACFTCLVALLASRTEAMVGTRCSTSPPSTPQASGLWCHPRASSCTGRTSAPASSKATHSLTSACVSNTLYARAATPLSSSGLWGQPGRTLE